MVKTLIDISKGIFDLNSDMEWTLSIKLDDCEIHIPFTRFLFGKNNVKLWNDSKLILNTDDSDFFHKFRKMCDRNHEIYND